MRKVDAKNLNSQFKSKLGAYTYSNIQSLMMMFTFTLFNQKDALWAYLIQKIKIASLSWNLVPRLIWIWWIQGWSSLFVLSRRNTLFGQICSKKQICQKKQILSSWNLAPTIMFIMSWDLLIAEQIFLSPQVKRSIFISNKLVYKSYLTSCPNT